MAERYLMTHSLLGSWSYVYSCWEGKEDEAMADFERTLRRERSEPSEAMLNGIEFEREVYKAAAGIERTEHKKWENGIQAVATVIKGAPVQVKLSRNIEVCGVNFLLYGVLDALKAGIIFDVKFSKSYDVGKYLDGTQHPTYLALVPEAYEFHYLVSNGDDVFTEVYRRKDVRPIEEIIPQFMTSIESMGFLPLYKEKWLAK